MTLQNQAYFADGFFKAIDLYFHTKRDKVKTDPNDGMEMVIFFYCYVSLSQVHIL